MCCSFCNLESTCGGLHPIGSLLLAVVQPNSDGLPLVASLLLVVDWETVAVRFVFLLQFCAGAAEGPKHSSKAALADVQHFSACIEVLFFRFLCFIEATRNKCHATRNKCHASSNKKLSLIHI